MAAADIRRITIETIDAHPGRPSPFARLGRTASEDAICLYTDGGRIVLPRSTVGSSGWQKLRAKLYEDAPGRGLSVEDLRKTV